MNPTDIQRQSEILCAAIRAFSNAVQPKDDQPAPKRPEFVRIKSPYSEFLGPRRVEGWYGDCPITRSYIGQTELNETLAWAAGKWEPVEVPAPAPAMDYDAEREAFEAYAREEGYDPGKLARDGNIYVGLYVTEQWKGWQARARKGGAK